MHLTFSISNRLPFTLAVILLSILSCTSDADTPTQNHDDVHWPTAEEQNTKLGRGINLGNALEAPTEGAWSVTLEERYFDLIDSVGFDAVRIPVRWSAHAQTDSPYTIDRQFLNRVDWAVKNALDRDLVTIINIHHYEEIMQDPEVHKSRFLALWKQLATHYKEHSPDLLFEVLNEPNARLTADLWNDYLAEAIQVIRESNPTRTLIVGTADWGGLGSLGKLEIPESEERVIVTYHYYEPFQFTHQGADWVEGSDAWMGTIWTGTEQQKQEIRHDFNQAEAWASQHGHPLFMGEFGAYSAAGLSSRVRWTNFVAREAEQRGFSWAYWEFCAGFGIYDPDDDTWNPLLLQALIPPQSDN